MKYRKDPDLEFLKKVPSSDLDILVQILTKDKEGNPRLTEGLTATERYKTHQPDHHRYWDLIAAEIQCFGANTLATRLRGGEGVLYREVLCDVCDKMKVGYNKKEPTASIEWNLLMRILSDLLEHRSLDELKELVDDLELETADFTPQAIITAIQTVIRSNGFLAYQVAVIVANAVTKSSLGRGIALETDTDLKRTISILGGPIVWTLVDIAGPAYRVTIPASIVVAYLRLKFAPVPSSRNNETVMESGGFTRIGREVQASERMPFNTQTDQGNGTRTIEKETGLDGEASVRCLQ